MDALPQTQLGSPAFIRQHYLSRSIKLYMIGVIIVGLFVSYYGIEKYLEYSDKTTIVSESEKELVSLNQTNKIEGDAYTKVQTDYKDSDESMLKELALVFPSQENYTELTKIFDAYFLENNRTNNPIIATDMQFGTPIADKSGKYNILPISMNITASEANFYKFLSYVQDSGTLSKKLRLLDLKSVQMNFAEDDTGPAGANKNKIQFRAEIQAYFQKDKL
ncbi:MAG: hypothetical protein NTX63_05115 [Candidatus Peregrinibacteria bacterium]|nr:hypothetical protein [Candidatus Peregrinibacteria bacterium]